MESMFIIILISIIRLSVPVIFTGLGNMFCEKAGVMNLGAEGMMIAGAFGAALGAYLTGNAWIGVIVGILCGMLVALIHALISVEFGGLQNISGLGLNALAGGLTAFFCRFFFGSGKSPIVDSIQSVPFLAGVPVIGKFLAQFSPLMYLLILLYVVSWYVVKKTVYGLRITAVGDDPKTVETAGIDVWRLRTTCVAVCGALAGLAGAYLSIGHLNIFVENMTMGKGMLAVIAVKMGRWDPKRIVAIAAMFSFFDALQLQLQMYNTGLPVEILQMIPFIVGVLAIAFSKNSISAPRQLNKPYVKNKFTM